jgi:hypothetical protein
MEKSSKDDLINILKINDITENYQGITIDIRYAKRIARVK